MKKVSSVCNNYQTRAREWEIDERN